MLPRALKTNHPGVPAAVRSINGSVQDVVVSNGSHVKCSKPHVRNAGRLLKSPLNRQAKSLFIVKTATNPADHVSNTISIAVSKALQSLLLQGFFIAPGHVYQ